MPPPVLHHATITAFFSSFFAIYLHFFLQNLAPWMPPRVDAWGRRTVRTHSARHCSLALESVMGKPEIGPEHGASATKDSSFTCHLHQYPITWTCKRCRECK